MNLQTKFSVASTLTAILVISLAAFGVHAISATDDLVIDLYNQPLMGVSYARAASTTFAEARALTVQGQFLSRSPEPVSVALLRMEKDILDDLRIVRQRMHDGNVAD